MRILFIAPVPPPITGQSLAVKVFFDELVKNHEVEVRSDSELLVKQVNGEYKIMEPKIQELFLEVWNLKTEFKKLKFVAVGREKNKEADKLVNAALDGQVKNQTLF